MALGNIWEFKRQALVGCVVLVPKVEETRKMVLSGKSPLTGTFVKVVASG